MTGRTILAGALVIALVAAYPIGYAFWLSLNEYSVRVEGLSRFVGFDNYARLTRDARFTHSLVNTGTHRAKRAPG